MAEEEALGSVICPTRAAMLSKQVSLESFAETHLERPACDSVELTLQQQRRTSGDGPDETVRQSDPVDGIKPERG